MSTVRFDAIIAAVVAAGYECTSDYSGGGCITIYAGTPWDEPGWGNRYPVLAGPGSMTDKGDVGHLGDLYVGPDDEGVSDALTIDEGWTEDAIAREIVRQIRSRQQ